MNNQHDENRQNDGGDQNLDANLGFVKFGSDSLCEVFFYDLLYNIFNGFSFTTACEGSAYLS